MARAGEGIVHAAFFTLLPLVSACNFVSAGARGRGAPAGRAARGGREEEASVCSSAGREQRSSPAGGPRHAAAILKACCSPSACILTAPPGQCRASLHHLRRAGGAFWWTSAQARSEARAACARARLLRDLAGRGGRPGAARGRPSPVLLASVRGPISVAPTGP
ncbi:unnamed protein product [Prorocentrum cordatum]|uniref:Uncharacterized protein n=1 Tax=Prorocentrum cordatum TaxID=2364126 RepID=A0ABN9WL54_9DINO|nr:unnamed protein product [Polarella glacialis]